MRETVVFIHGFWMLGIELVPLRRRVQACGFACHAFRYPSVRQAPEIVAARLDEYLSRIDAEVVHFVAHSHGGIVLLHLFDAFPMQRPGRILMLGTPIKGSHVARTLYRNFFGRLILGRAVEKGLLGDVPRLKGTHQVGGIAGSRGVGFAHLVSGLLGSPLGRPHDGAVAVHETRAVELNAHLVVPHSHFGMLFAPTVSEAVCAFLLNGRFESVPNATNFT